ncbi:branched-chain amino acid ABC transporter permease [Burkholderia plantarii]|uniref:ABC transporter, inner membrane protein n=1 Tax=Burkholderia plantarii TaxID=41899 RepID=A0A0B6RM78_BURPL|nr:branched-chain amino acid ABC transporter permease [Burkholderia plantarii]AJK46397.1 ABC transporter, inner membrane protein [Burkholderia plantarii]
MTLITNLGLLSFLALSAYVLAIAGDFSFGQQALFAIGAYVGASATVLGDWPLGAALAVAAAAGALSGWLLRAATLRLSGLRFSLAMLAAAETIRQVLLLIRLQRPGPDGEPIGPGGDEGFAGIRYVFEHGMTPAQVALIVWVTLALVLVALTGFERTRRGRAWRMVGEDPALAAALGIDARRAKLAAATLAGAVAALGGALYAHCSTYIEPDNFDVMIGIHGLSYALIGGLGSPFGPLLGVALDLGLLEGTRFFHGYRMIAFGGLVAGVLVVRPRGLIDEALVARLGALWPRPRRVPAAPASLASVSPVARSIPRPASHATAHSASHSASRSATQAASPPTPTDTEKA